MVYPTRFAVIVVLALLSATTSAPDLSNIDRSIVKEPIYKSKPKYCLLLFGPKAEIRVWLVLDGDTYTWTATAMAT